jgi:hypothetical protein
VGGDRIRGIYATGDAAIAGMCPNLLQNAPRLAPEETNDRDDGDKLVAASRTLIKAIETGQSARRLADVIMIDRNAAAAAEIAALSQKLAGAEARIREIEAVRECHRRKAESWRDRGS